MADAFLPLIMPLEHILTVDRVHAFLNDRGHGQLCTDLTQCQPWRVEPLLLDELNVLKLAQPSEQTAINEVRGFLRAIGWMTHERPALDSLLATLTGLETEQPSVFSHTDADLIKKTLTVPNLGARTEKSILAMEAAYDVAWKNLRAGLSTFGVRWNEISTNLKIARERQRIETLRPLRDQLYFQLLYPAWYRAGQTTPV